MKVTAAGPMTVIAEFPAPTASIEIIFDQVAIGSGFGPFLVTERKSGAVDSLKRNRSVLEEAFARRGDGCASTSSRIGTSKCCGSGAGRFS